MEQVSEAAETMTVTGKNDEERVEQPSEDELHDPLPLPEPVPETLAPILEDADLDDAAAERPAQRDPQDDPSGFSLPEEVQPEENQPITEETVLQPEEESTLIEELPLPTPLDEPLITEEMVLVEESEEAMLIDENSLSFPQDDQIEVLAPVVVTAEAETRLGTIFGVPLAENPLLKFAGDGTSVMTGKELQRKLGATLGQTLASEPGISASSYSPAVSRPIIRGFDGVRVRVLRDGLGTMDLSQDSPDHGVSIDSLMTEEIEIHRGPASLLYGNSAIGGAVNTRTRYIPSVDRGDQRAGTLIGGYDSQGSAFHWAAAGEMRGDFWALGFSASERDAGNISIPGRAWTEAYERLENPRIFVPGVGIETINNPSGHLDNSFHKRHSRSLGGRIGSEERLSLGVSFQQIDQLYGIPYFFGDDATDLFGDFSIDTSLDRLDGDLSYQFDSHSWLDHLRLKLGSGNYRHREDFRGQKKDSGRDFTETAFDKDALEGRLEIYFGKDRPWSGVFGIQFSDDNLEIERVVVPPPTLQTVQSKMLSEGLSFFTLNHWACDPWKINAGLRYELSDLEYTDEFGSRAEHQDHSFSQSLTVTHHWGEFHGWTDVETSFGISNIQRLPTAIERYAFYNSAALGRFLIGGDLDGGELEKERSRGVELSVRAQRGIFSAQLTAFHYRFENYTYPEDTRGVNIGRTAVYRQTDADFYGLEASGSWLLHEDPDGLGNLDLRLVGDVMRGKNRRLNDAPLPRIPAARLGFDLTWEHDRWSAALEGRYVIKQNRPAPFPNQELPTDDYFMINASASWLPMKDSEDLRWSLKLNNLLNAEARDHTSFRKETTPLPGFGLSTELAWVF